MHATDTDVHKGELRAIYLLFTVTYNIYMKLWRFNFEYNNAFQL